MTANRTPLPVEHSRAAAKAYTRDHPGALPPGAIDPQQADRAPSRIPVVLVHGTNGRASTDWYTLAPLLSNTGFQVFTFSWRRARPRSGGLATQTHAGELEKYLDKVVTATSAAQVDLVGHSWGAVLARHVARCQSGQRPWSVRRLVGLAPTYAGTTFNGLLRHVDRPCFAHVRLYLDDKLPSWREQAPGSTALTLVEAGRGDEKVDYTTVVTRFDRVVTPYDASLTVVPRATRIVLQDHARTRAGHLGILHHPAALGFVLAALTDQSTIRK